MKQIKLKRAHGGRKAGAVVLVDDLRAERMVADGLAEYVCGGKNSKPESRR